MRISNRNRSCLHWIFNGRTAGAEGKYELFKTTHDFDGTVENPQWLG